LATGIVIIVTLDYILMCATVTMLW